MEFGILVLLCVGIVVFLLSRLQGRKPSSDEVPYVMRSHLLSPAERSFFGVLQTAVSDDYAVLAKIRVADVILPSKGLDRSSWQSAFNRISAKHFDYVLCAVSDYKIVAAVELDDKSHNSKSRIKRDQFLNAAAKAASLPLIRFPARAAYPVAQIREKIDEAIDSDSKRSA